MLLIRVGDPILLNAVDEDKEIFLTEEAENPKLVINKNYTGYD